MSNQSSLDIPHNEAYVLEGGDVLGDEKVVVINPDLSQRITLKEILDKHPDRVVFFESEVNAIVNSGASERSRRDLLRRAIELKKQTPGIRLVTFELETVS